MTDHSWDELTLVRLWRTMRALSHRLDEQLSGLHLRTRQFGLLLLLAGGGPLTQRELGQAMNCDRSTMVTYLDGLEAAGYVRRRTHPRDRRANWVMLTAAGSKTLERAVAAAEALEGQLWAGQPANRRTALTTELRRLATAAGNGSFAAAHRSSNPEREP